MTCQPRRHTAVACIAILSCMPLLAADPVRADPPALEMRLLAERPDSDKPPQLPDDYESLTFRDASEPLTPENNLGFAWFPIHESADPRHARSSPAWKPIARTTEAGIRQVLVADRRKFGLLADGSWKVLSCEARPRETGSGSLLSLKLDVAGAEQMENLTKAGLLSRLAVIAEGEVIATPTIFTPLSGGMIIDSNLPLEKAQKISRALQQQTDP